MNEEQTLFEKLAPVVYGRYWKTDLAHDLDLDRGTILKWRAGVTKPYQSVIRFLLLASLHNYFYNRAIGKLERKHRGKSAFKP